MNSTAAAVTARERVRPVQGAASAPAETVAAAHGRHEVVQHQQYDPGDDDGERKLPEPPRYEAEEHEHHDDADDAGDDEGLHDELLFLVERRRRALPNVSASQRAVRKRRASPSRRPTSCTPSGIPTADCSSGNVTAGLPR